MKSVIVIVLVAASSFAQSQSSAVAPACGPTDVNFAVKQNDSQQAPAQPEPGKALIYFVQETGAGNCVGVCVTRIGLDGEWIGAMKHNSYFSLSVDPGEHHACVNIQSRTPLGKVQAFARFNAEAGKVYYMGTKAIVRDNTTRLEIGPIDSDQGKHLVASLPTSVSQPSK
jgi:Protein of unknown function (DUF2846)